MPRYDNLEVLKRVLKERNNLETFQLIDIDPYKSFLELACCFSVEGDHIFMSFVEFFL